MATPKKKKETATRTSWREAYIRILCHGLRGEDEFSSREEKQLEMDLAGELINDGYGQGSYLRETAMDTGEQLRAVTWKGPTTKGRLLADELTEKIRQESWRHKMKLVGIAVGSALLGILATMLQQWLTSLPPLNV